MALLTTTIGAFPKPEYLEFTNWFDLGLDTPNFKKTYASALNHLGKDPEKLFIKGTREVVLDQVNAGIDIPTDGEVRRENYIHYHCRHLEGIDFEKLS
jgi:5-methyltetrahydropteroyltriglutamate--homocysteine methyltransferase